MLACRIFYLICRISLDCIKDSRSTCICLFTLLIVEIISSAINNQTNPIENKAEQMKMKLFSLIAASLVYFIASAYGATTTFTSNTVITGNANFASGTPVVIADDVFVAYDNKNGPITNNYRDNVHILGELFIGDSGVHTGMSVYFNKDFRNDGNLVLDASNETSAPSFYFLGDNFLNNGNIFMVGIGNTGGVTMNVWNSGTVVNNGIISYYHTLSRNGGTSYLGRSGNDVTNDGTVCLYKMNMYQSSDVSGTGCYSVGEDSLLLYENPNRNPLASTQTVYLEKPNSQIRIGPYNMANTLKVAGWGDGNIIGFESSVSSFAYSGSILTVIAGGRTYKFDIGPNYNPALMSIGGGFSSGGFYITGHIKYAGAPTDTSRPAVCDICPLIPTFPSISSQSSSASSSVSPSTAHTESSYQSSSESAFSESSSEISSDTTSESSSQASAESSSQVSAESSSQASAESSSQASAESSSHASAESSSQASAEFSSLASAESSSQASAESSSQASAESSSQASAESSSQASAESSSQASAESSS